MSACGGSGSCFGVWSIGGCGCGGGTACQVATTVTTCAGAAVAGATVTVTQSGTTIGTDTTDSSGNACVTVPATGTFNVAVAKTGYAGSNQDVSVTCPTTVPVSLTANASGSGSRWSAVGCNSIALPGATLAINGGNYTTDSSGNTPYIALPNGTYTWTLSKSRFVTQTGSGTIGSCFTSGVGGYYTLSPAPGYACSLDCVDPIATTLYFTCAAGSLTLTYAGGTWTGCGSLSKPVDNCAGGTVAGSTPWIVYLLGSLTIPTGVVFVDANFYTKYEAVTLTSCAGLTYTCPPGGCVCTSVNAGSTPATTQDCPPTVNFSGTFSGFTGPRAIFNGTWTVTE